MLPVIGSSLCTNATSPRRDHTPRSTRETAAQKATSSEVDTIDVVGVHTLKDWPHTTALSRRSGTLRQARAHAGRARSRKLWAVYHMKTPTEILFSGFQAASKRDGVRTCVCTLRAKTSHGTSAAGAFRSEAQEQQAAVGSASEMQNVALCGWLVCGRCGASRAYAGSELALRRASRHPPSS